MSNGDQNKKLFKIGTRKSQLAMVQTYQVRDKLKDLYPDLSFEVVDMSTKGDEVLDRALYKIGDKSLFTKELENALLDEKVDFVVHSLKDLPSTLPDGLVIGSVLERVSPDDVIILRENSKYKNWEDLVSDEGNIIGTSSVRRTAQLRGHFPNLAFQDIRGNLNTRLKKLDDPKGTYEALILAQAGIVRLDWSHRIHRALKSKECLHAVGQGALAVECRIGDTRVYSLLNSLNDKKSIQAVTAERSFMKRLDGGCSAPLAAHAEVSEDGILILEGGVWSLDGKTCVKDIIKVNLKEYVGESDLQDHVSAILIPSEDKKAEYHAAFKAGIDLAEKIVSKGGKNVLEQAKSEVHALKATP